MFILDGSQILLIKKFHIDIYKSRIIAFANQYSYRWSESSSSKGIQRAFLGYLIRKYLVVIVKNESIKKSRGIN